MMGVPSGAARKNTGASRGRGVTAARGELNACTAGKELMSAVSAILADGAARRTGRSERGADWTTYDDEAAETGREDAGVRET